jgi:transcriptional regulator with XRE-family HTH domain
LAAELKRLREDSGLTTVQIAARVGMSSPVLNRSENHKRIPTPEEVSALLALYGVVGRERKWIMNLARLANSAETLEFTTKRDRSDRVHLATFERQAKLISHFNPLMIPGMFQTAAYARAVMLDAGLEPEDVESRVTERMDRQTILTKPNGPHYLAIIEEAALRRPIGGRPLMGRQVRKLVEVAKLPTVEIRVIPTRWSGFVPHGQFSLMEFAKSKPLVYVEHFIYSGFIHVAEDTRTFQTFRDRLVKISMGGEESVNFLSHVVADHERGLPNGWTVEEVGF